MLNPLDHIGLVPIALRRWARLRPASEWRDSEEWSAAIEGLLDGCRRYQADAGWELSTWIVWRIRAKLTILDRSRRRYRRRLRLACRLERERQKNRWHPDTHAEDCEWLYAETKKLPHRQREVLLRLMKGDSLRRISIDLHMHNAAALRHRDAGIAALKQRAFG